MSPRTLAGLHDYQRTRVKFGQSYGFADASSRRKKRRSWRPIGAAMRCLSSNGSWSFRDFEVAALASTGRRPVLLLELPFCYFMKKHSAKKHVEYVNNFVVLIRAELKILHRADI
ncbi:hypothetical protein BV898_18921 [Hypsibius exemplaris]|uniref:Uncharacterized protein n=1 Tax=Hypsibius exemplaris TaxID=2072580 RepID=A0A9X6NPV4_HYPEX|nr:hypothetical protein BV898_18921 [Hypsibius exemplaris]